MKRLLILAAAVLAVGCGGSSSSTTTTGTSSSTGTGNGTGTGSGTTSASNTNGTTSATNTNGTSAANTTTGTNGTSATNGTTNGTTTAGGCGSVTEQGDCNGATLEYCFSGDLPDAGTGVISIDCSMEVTNDPFTCGLIDASYGYDCTAATNTSCLFQDQSGNPIVVFCAGGSGAGCVLNNSGSACGSSLSACSQYDDGGFSPGLSCQGNDLYVACQVDQPVAYDCSAFSGTCTSGQCVVPAGQPCDMGANPLFVCQSGHTCTALPDGGMGASCI